MTGSSLGSKAEGQSLDDWIEEQATALRKWVQGHKTDRAAAARIQAELPGIDRERTTAQMVPKVKSHPGPREGKSTRGGG